MLNNNYLIYANKTRKKEWDNKLPREQGSNKKAKPSTLFTMAPSTEKKRFVFQKHTLEMDTKWKHLDIMTKHRSSVITNIGKLPQNMCII